MRGKRKRGPSLFSLSLLLILFLSVLFSFPSLGFIVLLDASDNHDASKANEIPIYRHVFEVISSTKPSDVIQVFEEWLLFTKDNDNTLKNSNQKDRYFGKKKLKRQEEKTYGQNDTPRIYEFHVYFMLESFITQENETSKYDNHGNVNHRKKEGKKKTISNNQGVDVFYNFSSFQKTLSLPGNIIFKVVRKKYGKGSYKFLDEEIDSVDDNSQTYYNPLNSGESEGDDDSDVTSNQKTAEVRKINGINIRINILNLFLNATSRIEVSNLNFLYTSSPSNATDSFHSRQALLCSMNDTIVIRDCTFSYLAHTDTKFFTDNIYKDLHPIPHDNNNSEYNDYSLDSVNESIFIDENAIRASTESVLVNETVTKEELASVSSELKNGKLATILLDYYGNERIKKEKQTLLLEEIEVIEVMEDEEEIDFSSSSKYLVSTSPALFMAKTNIEVSNSIFDSLSAIDGAKRKTLLFSERGDVTMFRSKIQNHELISTIERYFIYQSNEDKLLNRKNINHLIKGFKGVYLSETTLQNNMHYHYDTTIIRGSSDNKLTEENPKMEWNLASTTNLNTFFVNKIIENDLNDNPVSFINVPLSNNEEEVFAANKADSPRSEIEHKRANTESEILIQNSVFHANKIIRLSKLDNQEMTEIEMKENIVNIEFSVQEGNRTKKERERSETTKYHCANNFVTGNIFAFSNNFTSNNVKIVIKYDDSYPSIEVEEKSTTIKEELMCGIVTEFQNIIK